MLMPVGNFKPSFEVKLDLPVTDALSYGSEESSYLQHRNIDHLTYTSLQSISESLGLLP
ncbi:unnamed protein product, partial [Rotaria socialis]